MTTTTITLCPTCGLDEIHECECATCLVHGTQSVTRSGSFTGYAGGRCYWAALACGCELSDESNDYEAAR